MPRDNPPQAAPIQVSVNNLGALVSGGLQRILYPGGLDLLTPNLRLQAGALRDGLNFEIGLSGLGGLTGGYRRIGGYERFNGMPSPSDAEFQIVQVNAFSLVPSVGNMISQAGSGATGTVAVVNNAAGA